VVEVAMNRAARRSMQLVALLAGLVVVDVVAHVTAVDPAAAVLPALPEFDVLAVQALRLSMGDDRVTLDRVGPDNWRMSAPFEAEADRAAIVGILQALRGGVPMDVRVDEGSLETYGLQAPGSILVEVVGAEGVVLTSFVVGSDTAGGSTFVRLPEDDVVYRARIGGRARYDKRPTGWRDPMITEFAADQVASIGITRAGGTFTFERAAGGPIGGPGPWSLVERPGFEVDQEQADGLAAGLAALRAGEILNPNYPAGLETPPVVVTLRVEGEPEVRLRVGRTSAGTFIAKDGVESVYRVAGSILDRLDQDASTWADRRLLWFGWEQVLRMSLVEPSLTTVLEKDPATSAWSVVEPTNVAADLREAMYTARHLGALRADELVAVSAAEAGFAGGTKVVVTLLDGSSQTLEVGRFVPGRPPGREAVYVRAVGRPDRIGALSVGEWSRLRKAWAR
jgi:hypothetical protein